MYSCLFLNFYSYVHICVYICMYVFRCLVLHLYSCLYSFCFYIYICICTCICFYIFMYICVYVCVYVLCLLSLSMPMPMSMSMSMSMSVGISISMSSSSSEGRMYRTRYGKPCAAAGSACLRDICRHPWRVPLRRPSPYNNRGVDRNPFIEGPPNPKPRTPQTTSGETRPERSPKHGAPTNPITNAIPIYHSWYPEGSYLGYLRFRSDTLHPAHRPGKERRSVSNCKVHGGFFWQPTPKPTQGLQCSSFLGSI